AVAAARSRLGGVVERGGDAAHERAVGLGVAFEGELLGLRVPLFPGQKVAGNPVERPEAALLLGEVGLDVEPVRHAVAEGRGNACLDPLLRVEVVRIAEHDRQPPGAVAQRDAVAPHRLAVGDGLEGGRLAPQVLEGGRRHAQRQRQAQEKRLRRAAELGLEVLDEAAVGLARLLQVGGGDGGVGHACGLVHRHHWMFPASSKMGMYMSTTTRPTATPRTVMRMGSKARVAQSMKRATSSSWKRAIWANMPPMSPLRSPTAIMRTATGVARPAALRAADIGRPCSTA